MRKIPEECESLQDERKEYEDIEELKDKICGWLDDSIERGLPEDAKVTSATTDDKFYFLIHDVVMTTHKTQINKTFFLVLNE